MAGHGSKKSFAQEWLSLHSWVEYMGEWCVSRALFLWILYLGLLAVAALLTPQFPLFALGWLFGTAPLWLPVSLIFAAHSVWVWHIHSYFLFKNKTILLEIKIPREVLKSPRAMEMVFNSFWTTSGEVSVFARYWKGSVRPFFSFELCSFGGEIHFYVWCWYKYRRVVETAFYSQFPDVEIFEVEDYASTFVYDPSKHQAFVGQYKKIAGNLIPLRTYIDFELDKDPKEELKVDPLSYVFEVLSNLKPDEQVWIQFVIRALKQDGELVTKKDPWKNNMKAAIDDVRAEASRRPHEELDEGEVPQGFPHPTWRQTEQIKSMERALSKVPFEVGARHIYISHPDNFNGAIYTSVRWIWKNFHNPVWGNEFVSKLWHNDFDYPWQDWKGIRWKLTTRRFLDAYRRRSHFYEPWKLPVNVMSPEELATLWRFPSASIKAPGLRRSTSTKSEPPSNLPM